MIKKLIFDLDNTLIDWLDTYYPFSVENTCKDLNLSSNYISKIIDFNLSPRFVEFCLLNGIDDVYQMSCLREQYIDGKNVQSLFGKKKK